MWSCDEQDQQLSFTEAWLCQPAWDVSWSEARGRSFTMLSSPCDFPIPRMIKKCKKYWDITQNILREGLLAEARRQLIPLWWCRRRGCYPAAWASCGLLFHAGDWCPKMDVWAWMDRRVIFAGPTSATRFSCYLHSICYKLGMMGVPILGPTNMFGDNMSVVTNLSRS